jgi:hypothetical protein
MSTYATTADLQAQPGLALLDDAECQRLLGIAEDLIDDQLGALEIDEDTGRKLVVADLATWQQTKLTDATAVLAARIQATPSLLSGSGWTTQEGPDFKMSGPTRSGSYALLGDDVMAKIRALGVRRSFGRARPTG